MRSLFLWMAALASAFLCGCSTVREARAVQRNEPKLRHAGEYTMPAVQAGVKEGSTLTLAELKEVSEFPALEAAFRAALPAVAGPLYLRLVLSGPCPLNARLRGSGVAELEELFSRVLRAKLPKAELESVIVNTTAVMRPVPTGPTSSTSLSVKW